MPCRLWKRCLRPITPRSGSSLKPFQALFLPCFPFPIADHTIDGKDGQAVGGFRCTLGMRNVMGRADKFCGYVFGNAVIEAVDAEIGELG